MRACTKCNAAAREADRFCGRCGATLAEGASRDPLVGRTIAGAYVLIDLIAVGGMGRVYRAEHTLLGRTVAIKIIHPHLLGDEQSVARFYDEARAASRLNHSNSVAIIDFGRADDGLLYLVMELLRGSDLSRVMVAEGPLTFARIGDILGGVLAALREAHAIGVIHRDLKPENIFLEKLRDGRESVKVVDFGLAKIVGGDMRPTSITAPGLVCGTPDYMSPEQAQGDPVDARSDLYSLGVVLFELLTQRLPYVDESPTKVVLRHINDPIPDPRQAAPHRGIPAGLAEIAMRAMAKRPEHRFATAEAMGEALRTFEASYRAQKTAVVVCSGCGNRNATASRYCAECGNRLRSTSFLPPSETPTGHAGFRPLIDAPRMVGRDTELNEIDARVRGGAARLHLYGEPGIGKTRLAMELASRAAVRGDHVVVVGPERIGAPVPYLAARTAFASLLGVEPRDATRAVTGARAASFDTLSRAGAREMFEPGSTSAFDRRPRTTAVAEALVVAVQAAIGRATSGCVLVVADDFHLIDAPSRAALAAFSSRQGAGRVCLLTTGSSALGIDGDVGVEPLTRQAAGEIVSIQTFEPDPVGTRYTPLYLQQLRRLGPLLEGDVRPSTVADAVMQRLDRMTLGARRLVQAAAVIGDLCDESELVRVADPGTIGRLDDLIRGGFVRRDGSTLIFEHPFVRELVASTIPAEVRAVLHARALDVMSEGNTAVEVRAEHARRAGEAIAGLVLLEQVGARAMGRGDIETAVTAFRTGLQSARKEALRTAEPALERAAASFSRKLAEALEVLGDVVGADGVVREALDLVDAGDAERVPMLLCLARVAARRDRGREASRLVGEALAVAERLPDRAIVADVYVTQAIVRRAVQDIEGAALALDVARSILSVAHGTPLKRANVMIDLSTALADLGRTGEATRALDEARVILGERTAPAIEATILGAMAAFDLNAGRTREAAARFEEAARLAAECGDDESRDRWDRALRAISHAA